MGVKGSAVPGPQAKKQGREQRKGILLAVEVGGKGRFFSLVSEEVGDEPDSRVWVSGALGVVQRTPCTAMHAGPFGTDACRASGTCGFHKVSSFLCYQISLP